MEGGVAGQLSFSLAVLESSKSDLVGKQRLQGHFFCMQAAADQMEALCDSNRVSSQKPLQKIQIRLYASTTTQHRLSLKHISAENDTTRKQKNMLLLLSAQSTHHFLKKNSVLAYSIIKVLSLFNFHQFKGTMAPFNCTRQLTN